MDPHQKIICSTIEKFVKGTKREGRGWCSIRIIGPGNKGGDQSGWSGWKDHIDVLPC
jgi:hypothetical protein